jgi:hypothetical protein
MMLAQTLEQIWSAEVEILTVVVMNSSIFQDTTLCFFDPEYGGNIFPQNLTTDNMALYHSRQISSGMEI